jgi:hypothetical protein
MEVETGDGRSFSVAIPEGVEPGEEFEIEFEDTTAPDLSGSWQEDDGSHAEEESQPEPEPEPEPEQTLADATQDEEEEVDAFDDELADLLGSSDGSDCEDADFQEVEEGDEEAKQESPRAAREREAEELRRRLDSLESDAGSLMLPSTGLPFAAPPNDQNGRDQSSTADASVELAADEEDPFSALAALLPG